MIYAILLLCCCKEKPIPEILDEKPIPEILDEKPEEKEIPEADVTHLPTWSSPKSVQITPNMKAITLTTSDSGRMAFGYRNGWRLENGEPHPLEHPPLLMAWSADGQQLGILSSGSTGYDLLIFLVDDPTQMKRVSFELPAPDTSGDYPDPTPNYLGHIPAAGGWMVDGSLGAHIITDTLVTPFQCEAQYAGCRFYRDAFHSNSGGGYGSGYGIAVINDSSFAPLWDDELKVIEGALSVPLPCPAQSAVWHSGWNNLVVQCISHGSGALHLLDSRTGESRSSLQLGTGISGLGLVAPNTVVALERGNLLRWSPDGVERLHTDPAAKKGCSAMLSASQELEPLAESLADNGQKWVIGPAIGKRWTKDPAKLALVDLGNCTVRSFDIPGQLILNNTPIWLAKQRAFLAEINQDGRYGPAVIPVDSPDSWKYLFDENIDPTQYSVSEDGAHLVIGHYKWVRFFNITTDSITQLNAWPESAAVMACPDNFVRQVKDRSHWVVHQSNGTPVAVLQTRENRIECPMPDGTTPNVDLE
jgi:hypothetical protein